MWEVVETSIGEVRVGEAKRRRGKGRDQEKEGGKREEEETKKGEDNGGEESSRRMGNLGGERKSSEVKGRGEEVGPRTIL